MKVSWLEIQMVAQLVSQSDLMKAIFLVEKMVLKLVVYWEDMKVKK
jgi:hypothetical protein